MIRLKRAYEPPEDADGTRVLVERLWPRGVSKEAARLDRWTRDLAPSPALRRWYAHEPERWEAFRARYRSELEAQPESLGALADLVRRGPVTFVFAARDRERNSARVLREVVLERIEATPDSERGGS